MEENPTRNYKVLASMINQPDSIPSFCGSHVCFAVGTAVAPHNLLRCQKTGTGLGEEDEAELACFATFAFGQTITLQQNRSRRVDMNGLDASSRDSLTLIWPIFAPAASSRQ